MTLPDDVTAQLVDVVRRGRTGALLPPVVTTADGLVRIVRELGGPADACWLDSWMRGPAGSMVIEMFAELAAGCEELNADFAAVIDPRVLNPLNDQLFGPLTRQTFLAALAGPGPLHRFAAALPTASLLTAIRLFLRRVSAEEGLPLPITEVFAQDGETHNGGQRVLRVTFADGTRWAYKPRPADVDRLFLDRDDSVFAVLNRSPSASGPVRLPVMSILPRDGWAWHQWIEPPDDWGPIHRDESGELLGTRLTPEQAGPFWRAAGSLAAACFAFGITDLMEHNTIAGQPGPLYYPVDLELAFSPIARLTSTGLVPGANAPHHHVAFEEAPRRCAAEGPTICLVEPAPGEFAAERRRQPWARAETRNVVADTDGAIGYAGHPLPFLRGMFDAWTLICRTVPALREVLARPATVRVLLRPTADYTELLDDHLLSGVSLPDDLEPSERDRLLRLDVPYYFRSTDGGDLMSWDPAVGRPIATPSRCGDDLPPAEGVRHGDRLTLAGVGVAIRDAVVPVADRLAGGPVIDDELGVRLLVLDDRRGAVGFDWEQADRRIVYRWDGQHLSVKLSPLGELREVRDRLLRLDRADSAWRGRWTEGGFTDTGVEEKLRRLTGAGADWLGKVVEEHGWPGDFLVGVEAAAAACRLVQHLEDRRDFQQHCLILLTEAAAAGEVPRSQPAYLTDAIRVAGGEPQVYGTKFAAVDGELVPCPLEDPVAVDELRAAAGLDSLADYTVRVRARFTATEV